MDITEFWNGLPADVRDSLIRLLLAGLVIVLVLLLRRLLAAILIAPIRRLFRLEETTWDDTLISAIRIPVSLLALAFGLALGAQILLLDAVTSTFIQHLIRTLVIIAIMLAAYRAVNVLTPTSTRLFRLTGLTVPDRLLPFLRTGVKLLIAAIAVIIVVQEWGYDVSGLVAGLGVGGLAVSLAAQDTLANLFGFTMIVGDRPFVVGEFIKTPDIEGIVEHVGMRSTRLRQLDQAYVTIPNGKLAGSAILNWSRLSKRRLDARLCIRYDARPEQLVALLERIRALLNAHEKTEPDSVIVFLIEFGNDGLIILVRANLLIADWIEFTAEKEKLFIEILKIVEELGLSIAFPSRSVYIENAAPRFHEARSETSPSIEGE